ncbi:MAG: sporulation inhibitor of replication protein SirA [Firmicutes bacterium]|nr:sporulation inhibitor of replication protein SirA [Bacillota bacterium]
MRIYYIFNIKEPLYNLYYKKEYVLYDVLEELYKLNKKDLVLGYKFFNEFALPFNKLQINTYIYNKEKDNITYIKNLNNHIINDRFNNENSILTVFNSHLLLKTNKDISKFLKILNGYNSNLFICDFNNHDYFWLSNIVKVLV